MMDFAIAGADAEWRAKKSYVIEQMLAGAPLASVLNTLCHQAALQARDSHCCVILYDAAKGSFSEIVGAQPDGFATIQSAIESHDAVTQWRMDGDLAPYVDQPFHGHDSTGLTLSIASTATGSAVLVVPFFIDHYVFRGVLALVAHEQVELDGRRRELMQDAALVASMAVKYRRAQDKLRITEVVFDASQSAIIVTDTNNRIVLVNPAFTRITGYSLDDVFLKTPKVLSSGRHTREFYRDMWQSLHEHGAWHGETCNRKKSGELYYEWLTITARKDESGGTEGYVGIFTDISDLKQAQQVISYQATHDPLTGLWNRKSCEELINKTIRHAYKDGPQFAMLFVDLDDFKDINDTHGHSAGEIILREAAQRLQFCTRKAGDGRQADILGRFGGDEFVIIANGVSSESDAEAVAEKINKELRRDVEIEGTVVHMSASIGIAIYPGDADDAIALRNCAIQAMYEAKRNGRGHYVRYSSAIHYAARTRAQLKSQLKQALNKKQLSVHYQPMVDLKSGKPIKAEALIRWLHPEIGYISPATFVPLAEEVRIIDAIGLWVIETALQHLKDWRLAGFHDVGVSINLSPYQLAEPNFMEAVLATISRAEVPSESITFEITEGVIMEDRHDCHTKLKELKRRGVSIALDDFGTGYSSLSYIKKYDIDYIKIDKVFVDGVNANLEDRVLVETMILMAAKLGIKIIVEGVETVSQLKTLEYLGAEVIQGYYFSKPLPHVEFVAWLINQRRSMAAT